MNDSSVFRPQQNRRVEADAAVLTGREDDTPCPTNRVRIPALDDNRSALLPNATSRLRRYEPFSPRSNDRVALFDSLPKVGEQFLNFTLIGVLGRGSFGRVYLARQADLADRLVALKISSEIREEPQKLARLQHSNIVPVYSVHRVGMLQAVCMPYFGSVTLAHVIEKLGHKPGAFPGSGRGLLSAVFDREKPTRNTSDSSVDAGPELFATSLASPVRSLMERMSFVDAVLWIVSHVADGLAHAHERGILHRDLKPANILISDEGQPMLLDFNLAHDTHVPQHDEQIRLGGTLPYMSPELLDACAGGVQPIDERNDLYGLGVIFFELLTGQQPFASIPGPMEQAVLPMLTARLRGAPSPRAFNPAVPEAVASIVLKLLDPHLERRYQSAAQLREDLERQLTNQPLKFAPDGSFLERARKWRKRHPRLTVSGFIGTLVSTLLFLPGTIIAIRRQQSAERRRQAETAAAKQLAADLGQKARTAQVLLATRIGDRILLSQGIENGHSILDRYGIGRDPNWMSQPIFARLPAEQQTSLRFDLAEMLLFMARGELLRAGDSGDAKQRIEGWRAALRWNRLAEACYPDRPVPRLLARQRNELLALLPDERAHETGDLVEAPDASDYDRYHEGSVCAMAGRYRDALAWLRPFCEDHPQHFAAWFVRGLCHDCLGQFAESVSAYSICIAVEPALPWAYFNRGVVRLQLYEYPAAEGDLGKAIHLRGNWTAAYLNRAIARKGRKDYAGARDDLNTVLRDPNAPVRALFLRAEVKQLENDNEGAKQDRAEAMRLEPRDELSWSTRGYARMAAEPAAALQDFDQALAINPRSREALLNKSIVLSESLNRPMEALAVLDRLLAFYPGHCAAKAGRGVVLARVGECDRARQDAADCLCQERTPFLLFQMTGLFAQVSRHEKDPDARDEAIRLLGQSLRMGFTNLKLLKSDTDLDPIRNEPEFKRLADAAERMQPQRT